MLKKLFALSDQGAPGVKTWHYRHNHWASLHHGSNFPFDAGDHGASG